MSFIIRIPENLLESREQGEKLLKEVSDNFLELNGSIKSLYLTKTAIGELYKIPAGLALDGNGTNDYIAVHFKLPAFAAGNDDDKQQLITAITNVIWSEMKGKIGLDRIFVNMHIKTMVGISGKNYQQKEIMDLIASGD